MNKNQNYAFPFDNFFRDLGMESKTFYFYETTFSVMQVASQTKNYQVCFVSNLLYYQSGENDISRKIVTDGLHRYVHISYPKWNILKFQYIIPV